MRKLAVVVGLTTILLLVHLLLVQKWGISEPDNHAGAKRMPFVPHFV